MVERTNSQSRDLGTREERRRGDHRASKRNNQEEELRTSDESSQGERKGQRKTWRVCINCALSTGSSFGTENAYIERYTGNVDVFFGIEHRMKGEEAEKQFNKLANSSLKIAVDEARDTEESKGEENTKHTSGGVFIAIDGARSSVVHKEEGAMRAIPCNGGRLFQASITVKAGLQASLKSPSGIQKDGRSATIDFLKLVACDANMEAEAFVCS